MQGETYSPNSVRVLDRKTRKNTKPVLSKLMAGGPLHLLNHIKSQGGLPYLKDMYAFFVHFVEVKYVKLTNAFE